ncbi:MAG: TolC family protein [Saprospiraceae bacterium]|nr:TolC family protein [Saprospiraceae bacterium]
MKRNFFFIIACLPAFHSAAQAALSTRTLSLAEGIQMAVDNSSQVRKTKIDRQILERRVKEARSEALPQISADVNLDWWGLLPTQLMPGEVLGLAENTYVPVQFGRPWQMGGNIILQQSIINESARHSVPALNATRRISDLVLERSEDEVIYSTATVYYQTLQTEQLLRGVDANLAKLEALQGMAELQLANGYVVPTDVKRIRVARTNLETQRQNLLTGISSLRQTLQFLCGLPLGEPLELSADIGSPAADSARWQGMDLIPEATTENKLLQFNLELTRIRRLSTIAEGLPSLSAYATVAAQGFRNDINFFDPDRRWYGAAAAGVRLKVPIFDGFRLHNKGQILKLEAEKIEEDSRQLINAKTLEFRQAREQLGNSLRLLRAQSDNVALAREITDKLLLQYKEGVASLTDLLNAQTALSEAETNYWQQVFNYKLAVLKLLKAVGQLKVLKG